MLKINHFFQGKLSKEEVASAFLAMALEGPPSFRNHFFDLIAPEDCESLKNKNWDIQVEVRNIDVRMDAGDTVILIENKINAGAKQKSQLLRYHKQERRHNPHANIISVYLAPGSIGKGEVALVHDSPEFQGKLGDFAYHLSWETLSQYAKRDGEIIEEIISAGLEEICRIIEEARVEKYSDIGDRNIIRNIVKRAMNSISEHTGVQLCHWPGRENEQIYTNKTNITLWLDTEFKAEEEPPFAPINLFKNGLNEVNIKSQFKLEGKVKKNSDLGMWWRQFIESGFMNIPGVGTCNLVNDKWFVFSQSISGNEQDIEKAIVNLGTQVLKTLSQELSVAGFNL